MNTEQEIIATLHAYREVEGCTCFMDTPCRECIENPLICSKCEYRPDES